MQRVNLPHLKSLFISHYSTVNSMCSTARLEGCVFVTNELKQVFDTFPVPDIVPLKKAQQDTGQSYCMIIVSCAIK